MALILSLDLSFTLRLKVLLMSSEREPGHRWARRQERGKRKKKKKKRPTDGRERRANVSSALPSRVNFNINCIKWPSPSLSPSRSKRQSEKERRRKRMSKSETLSLSQADDAGECLITHRATLCFCVPDADAGVRFSALSLSLSPGD